MKQIVGGTLRDGGDDMVTNFESDRPSSWFAELFRRDGLTGGHVIKLGPGNDTAAREALAAYPGGLQIGGGIRRENASDWLGAGASHVIVTSYLFDENGCFHEDRLREMGAEVGKDRLVVDLSCRRTGSGWTVAMNRWQQLTDLEITPAVLDALAGECDEFLVHAADVEGLCGGIDRDLVGLLGSWGKIPVTYAGGASSLRDFALVEDLSTGRVDLTVGSALDLFGGSGVRYEDCVAYYG